MTQARRSIGVMVDWLEDEYQNQVFAGIESAAREQDVNLICLCGGLLEAPYRFGRERNFVYGLIERSCLDGLVVFTGAIANHVGPARLAEYLTRFAPLPMCSVGVHLPGVPSIVVDNARGIREGVSRLVRVRGARRIAFLRGPVLNEEAELRYRAYQEELRFQGVELDPQLIIVGDFQRRSGVDAVRVLLDERRVRFDALVAANDYMALGALDALVEREIDVPGQVAVFGFDDVDDAPFASVPLSTVRQPLFEQGKSALKYVLQQLSGEQVPEELVLNTRVVVRQSCGTAIADKEVPSLGGSDQSLADALRVKQLELTREMDEAVRFKAGAYEIASPERLPTALALELGQDGPSTFRAAVKKVLDEHAALGARVSAWQAAIDVLRKFSLPHLRGSERSLQKAEAALHGARALISEVAEYEEAQKRLRQARQLQALRRIGEALSTAMTETEVMAVAKQRLSSVGIPSAFVILYHSPVGAPKQARLALVDLPGAAEEASPLGRAESAVIAAEHVLSDKILPADRRFSYVVQPLFSKQEQLGVALFEVGPERGVVYEFLREQISSSLKGASLIKQVIEETARRQAAEKEQIERELELAARIQTTILPRRVEVPGLEIAATMLPATRVGGDYYEVLPFAGGCWLGIGDVAGHGLQTGLVMLMIQSVVAGLCRHSPDATPHALLEVLNGVIYDNVRERLGQDEHATLALIRYTNDGKLVIAGGHEDIIVCHADGDCELVPTPGPWVGAFEEVEDSNVDFHFQLRDGDLIVLYTDGVTEALDAKHRQFGLERLVKEVQNVHEAPVADVLAHLLGSVRRWLASQHDDITLLVARYARPA